MLSIELLARIGPATDSLAAAAPGAMELADRFHRVGHELSFVGGAVRDALLDRPITDIDLTTDAPPEAVLELVDGWADAVWDVGIRFGTVGMRKGSHAFEITTYRTDAYEPDTRKPFVQYGTSLEEDLTRRDFTVNAMAIRAPSLAFVDPHGGITDLATGVLRTPSSPDRSFGDDPLRMMRAARFAAQLRFDVDPPAVAAMTAMADRLGVVSAERIRDEFNRLLLADSPIVGLRLLTATGLAHQFLPELPALQLEIDEWHRHKDVYEHSLMVLEQAIALETSHEPTSQADLVLRLAALLHDIGKPATRRREPGGKVSFHHHEVVGARMVRKRLTAMRYPTDVVDSVTKLTELHLRFHGYGDGAWTDSAVRRYARDAGDGLVRLHKLTRADCTGRNRRRTDALSAGYDSLERRIAELAEQEELSAIRPDLDGNQIMEILGIGPGREVGQAYRHLLEVRLDEGPLELAEAQRRLRSWWDARGDR